MPQILKYLKMMFVLSQRIQSKLEKVITK